MTEVGRGRAAAVVVGVLAVALVLAGVGVAGLLVLGGGGAPTGVGSGGRVATPVQLRHEPPRLSALGARHGTVASSHPLRLRLAAGSFLSVSVRRGDGDALPGHVTRHGHAWSSTGVLVPQASYQVTARLRDDLHRRLVRHLRLVTTPARHVATTAIAPLTGRVVGVGQPIVVRFSEPVRHRAAVERGLQVAASTPVTGAWHWISDSETHFRPRAYWPAGEQVQLRVRLRHTQVDRDVWGEDRVVSFAVGHAHVSLVDVTAHRMTVRSDGKVLRVLKVSTGRDKYPTRGGVHIVIEKQPKRIMDSATVGIPKGDPDYYRETVLWDVRISYGGAFVHSAPWSVDDQGVRNVSHGCVNLAPDDARWFYGLAQPGDIVDIVHADAEPMLSDPGMADWNLSWGQWLDGSATGPVTTASLRG